MAMTFKTTTNELAQMIRAGIEKDLELIIKERLMEVAEKVVSDIACDLASKLSVAVQQYTKLETGEVTINLMFNSETINYRERGQNANGS